MLSKIDSMITGLGLFGKNRALNRVGWLCLCAAIMWAILAIGGGEGSSRESEAEPFYTAQQGPLTISILSSGNVRSSEAEIIKNLMVGKSVIKWIIKEGTQVEEGELLLEFDASTLEENLMQQEILVETGRAEVVAAREKVEMEKKEGQEKYRQERVDLLLAILDLEKYGGVSIAKVLGLSKPLDHPETDLYGAAMKLRNVDLGSLDFDRFKTQESGAYEQLVQKADNTITLAEAELKRAKDKMDGSASLAARGYITQTELEADELDYERKKLNLSVAISEKSLLENFTKRREMAMLMSEVDEAVFRLEKAQHEAKSTVIDAEAKLIAEEIGFERKVEKLEDIQEQLGYTKVYAGSSGMVIYGTTYLPRSSMLEPLKEGVDVRLNQELFRIPKEGSMIADIKIHESMLDKVALDMPVIVKTDALPNQEFYGKIMSIAVMPDSQSRWLNPDLKVYNTEILIAGDGTLLRPGMSCTAEIIAERFEDIIYVPIQAVVRKQGKPYVYLHGGDPSQPELREVEVGSDNNRMIHIVSGLSAGERVMLAPPIPSESKKASKAGKLPEMSSERFAELRVLPDAASEGVGPKKAGKSVSNKSTLKKAKKSQNKPPK